MFRLVRGFKGFKFRIYPSEQQIQRLLAWESALRFLWNLALEQRKLGLARPARCYLTSFDQINQLTELRAEVPFLSDVPRNVCAQLLVELDKAWQRCFSRISQIQRLLAWESALRFLWNLALEQRKLGLARPARCYPTSFDQINQLTELRAELLFLADVPRNVCAQVLVELDKAWQRCFSRIARAPRFKRKGRDSLGLTEPHPKVWRLQGNTLRFPKLGNLRAVIHRPLEGKPKSCTIQRGGDQWFVSIVCEVDRPDPVPRIEPVVGIDRGITHLIADSEGCLVGNPKPLEAALERLARAQRAVSRRKKGSNNRKTAVLRVTRLHRKVRRQRDHLLHTLSAAYAKSHGTVVVERLQTANM